MRAVWLTGLATLLLLAGLGAYLAPLEPGVLVLQLSFTPGRFGAIVHAWSPADLARFRAHLPVDFVLLAAYGAFGWLLAQRAPWFAARRPFARWLLPAAACFDALENVLHGWLTAAPRFGAAPVYALAGGAAALKWTLLLAFAALALHALWRSAD